MEILYSLNFIIDGFQQDQETFVIPTHLLAVQLIPLQYPQPILNQRITTVIYIVMDNFLVLEKQ